MSLLISEIEKSFSRLEKLFSAEELSEFLRCPYEELALYHFGLGFWVRNNLLLPKSALFSLFQLHNVSSADEMSALIIRLFYLHLQGRRLSL